jgi:hypothetical protein
MPLTNMPTLNIPFLNMSQNMFLNMPIQNEPTSKGYGRELNIIIKIYIEESKYRGNRDSFDFKLAIFHNIYGCTDIPYKAKAKAFLIMLKGLALNFFYLNNTINKSSF